MIESGAFRLSACLSGMQKLQTFTSANACTRLFRTRSRRPVGRLSWLLLLLLEPAISTLRMFSKLTSQPHFLLYIPISLVQTQSL